MEINSITVRNSVLEISDADNDVSRNINVVITLNSLIVPVMIYQISKGDSDNSSDIETIKYDRAVDSVYNGTIVDGMFVNNLNSDRFTPISILENFGTGFTYYLYHDDLFKDLILIPNLKSIGVGNEKNILKNGVINIEGYRIGVPNTILNSQTISQKVNLPCSPIPKPVKKVSSTKHLFRTFLKGQSPIYENNGIMMKNGDTYMESTHIPTTTMNSIGSSSDLFNSDIDICAILDVGFNVSSIVKAGKIDVKDILIPIP